MSRRIPGLAGAMEVKICGSVGLLFPEKNVSVSEVRGNI
jgi:hypothetical protein